MLYSLTVSIFPNWFLISVVTWKGDTAITLRKWKTILFPQIWITCRQVKSTVQWIMWPWSSYNSFEFYRVLRGPVSFDKHLTAKISPEQLSWTFDLVIVGITLPVNFAFEAKRWHSFISEVIDFICWFYCNSFSPASFLFGCAAQHKYKSRLSGTEQYLHRSSNCTWEILSTCLINKVCGPAFRENQCLSHKPETRPANCFLTDHFLFCYQEQHRVDNSIWK